MSHINIIIKFLCCVPITNGEDAILTFVLPLCSAMSLDDCSQPKHIGITVLFI